MDNKWYTVSDFIQRNLFCVLNSLEINILTVVYDLKAFGLHFRKNSLFIQLMFGACSFSDLVLGPAFNLAAISK